MTRNDAFEELPVALPSTREFSATTFKTREVEQVANDAFETCGWVPTIPRYLAHHRARARASRAFSR